jgi:hypothetical protein
MTAISRRHALGLLLAPFALAGCAPDAPNIGGYWYATVGGRNITLNLTDDSGDLDGNGSITNPTGSLFVGGVKTDHEVHLDITELSGGGVSYFDFDGTIEGDDIVGAFAGVFVSGDATLYR